MNKFNICLIVLFTLVLCSCGNKTQYKNTDDLISDYKEEMAWYKKQGYLGFDDDKILGKYGEGYLFVTNRVSIIDTAPLFKSTIINNIEIYHTFGARFTYFLNINGSIELYVGLENIYSRGYLTNDDLLDIQAKLNEWKNQKIPYSVGTHYPID